MKTAARGLAATAAVGAAGYAALVVLNRVRYGHINTSASTQADFVLDRFMLLPEVEERHQIAINAPADVVLDVAKDLELLESPIVRALIRARELALGGEPDARPHPTRLLEQMLSIGWVVLAERAGREVVVGAVTQPWEAAPVFRSVPAEAFRDFAEPGYVRSCGRFAPIP